MSISNHVHLAIPVTAVSPTLESILSNLTSDDPVTGAHCEAYAKVIACKEDEMITAYLLPRLRSAFRSSRCWPGDRLRQSFNQRTRMRSELSPLFRVSVR